MSLSGKITSLLFAIVLCCSATMLRAQKADTSANFDVAKELKLGATYVLSNVVFKIDRHKMTRQSKDELEKLYAALNNNPKLKIKIEGHVCCIQAAMDAYDLGSGEPYLSVNRAKAVYDYLIKKGIAASRLSYEGLGKSKPIIEEKTAKDATKNRRVEIRIMEN